VWRRAVRAVSSVSLTIKEKLITGAPVSTGRRAGGRPTPPPLGGGQAGGRRRLHWAYGPPLTQRVGRRAKPGASNGSGHKPLGQAASFAGKSYSDT
jgi:hypothetical protein